MEQGIWKKYEETTRKSEGERASYHDLYDDLKNSRRGWEIAQSLDECKEQLCGVDFRTSGVEPEAGDIYVYYVLENGKLIPILYFKITRFDDGKINHFIEYNGNQDGYVGIPIQYFPELIRKLKEIDSEKNKKDIDELQTRYDNYQKLLELQSKKEYTEEELLFLYNMNRREDIDKNLIEPKINGRNIEDDYESFSEEGKARLFLTVKGTELANRLSISSKKVMTLIAAKECLMSLHNASLEILSDKDYIIELLQVFFDVDQIGLQAKELNHLPECYRIDSDIISLILYRGTPVTDEISNWLKNSPVGKENLKNPEFAYKLIEAFIRGRIRIGESYFENELLGMFSNKILEEIEKHIMFGPEPNPPRGLWSGEDLKQISYQKLLNHRAKVLQYRKEH